MSLAHEKRWMFSEASSIGMKLLAVRAKTGKSIVHQLMPSHIKNENAKINN